jgi:NAD+ kinase
MSETAIRRVGVVVKPHQHEAVKMICELIAWLDKREIKLVGEPTLDRGLIEQETGCVMEVRQRDELAADVDLLLVLGGDGTMIGTSRMIGDREVPVLGINFGTLGYLAEFRIDEIFPALESILNGDYRVDPRLMLDVEHYRGEVRLTQSRVLNDVVINKTVLARIIELEAYFSGKFVNSFRADGLIVATPTGSTAYNLSAGGPVVYPSMNAIVVTPICPFTLSNRPIVIPDDAQIELRLKTEREEVAVTLDGQVGFPFQAGDRILIHKSKTSFNLIQPANRNYFDVLRDKLRWGR